MSIEAITGLRNVPAHPDSPSSRNHPDDRGSPPHGLLNRIARDVSTSLRAHEQALTLIQTADAAADSIADILQEMRDLSSTAADDSLTHQVRHVLEADYDALVDSLDEIVWSTRYGGQTLLDGSLGVAMFELGAASDTPSLDLDFPDLSASALGLEDVSLADAVNADDALMDVDRALATVDQVHANLGTAIAALTDAYLDQQAALRTLTPAGALTTARAVTNTLSRRLGTQSAGLSPMAVWLV